MEKYKETNIPLRARIKQKLWSIVSFFIFRPFSGFFFNRYRVFVLKSFGAKIGKGSIIYASVFIPAPWKLKTGMLCCLGPSVKLHIDETVLGDKVTISQGAYLCSGTHNISYKNKPFTSAPIFINSYAWVAAEAFVGPGVMVGEGAVVGARAAVFKDVDDWSVVGGNPAKFIKKRVLKDE
jgi:putative colanic acid biosynthesis acetyltransferase WcaF